MGEKKSKLIKYTLITSSLMCSAFIADSIYNALGGKVLTGKKIKIDNDATVYSNLSDMINEKNGKENHFDSSYDRLVISTFYKLDGEYIRVDMTGDYETKEQQIIDQDGILVGVITTIDFVNKTPEAYYNIDDFTRKELKQKKLIKK
jgi:hypothetical protein